MPHIPDYHLEIVFTPSGSSLSVFPDGGPSIAEFSYDHTTKLMTASGRTSVISAILHEIESLNNDAVRFVSTTIDRYGPPLPVMPEYMYRLRKRPGPAKMNLNGEVGGVEFTAEWDQATDLLTIDPRDAFTVAPNAMRWFFERHTEMLRECRAF